MVWQLFTHYLLSRRAGALIRIVAWLCLSGVCVGVMALVVVLSVMNGFNDSIRRRLLAVEPHLVVQMSGVNDYRQLQESAVYRMLKSRPELKTNLYESQDVIIRTVDGFFGGAVARGIDADSLRYIREQSQAAETRERTASRSAVQVAPLDVEASSLEANEILVGSDLARSLGIFEGDRITVVAPEALLLPSGEIPQLERVSVKGMMTTNLADVDASHVFYTRGKSFLRLRDSASKQVGIEVRVPDPHSMGPLISQIQKLGGHVETWMQRNSSIFHALRMEKIAMGTFLGLSALIASFSIVTVLVLLLTQKRKDIGVFMALGLSQADTRMLFLKLGLALSSIGIGSGLVLGLIICYLIDRFPVSILPDIYYDSTIPATIDPLVISGVIIGACIVAFFSAWLPVRYHTNMMPAEALRSRPQ